MKQALFAYFRIYLHRSKGIPSISLFREAESVVKEEAQDVVQEIETAEDRD